MSLDPAHVEWCRRHFAMMNDGGVWAIPRSGIIFRREGERLVLVAEMPWTPAMAETITSDELADQQRREFELNRRHFAAAGVEVVRREEEATDDS